MIEQLEPLQQAPVAQGFGVQVVPPMNTEGALQALCVVAAQVVPVQQAPVAQGSGEQELAAPWYTPDRKAQMPAVTLGRHTAPVQQAPVAHALGVQAVPLPW